MSLPLPTISEFSAPANLFETKAALPSLVVHVLRESRPYSTECSPAGVSELPS